MAGVTSLLRSAASTRKKVRSQEDSVKAFEWESSLQTRDDYNDYRDYLEQRQSSTSDASEQLGYFSKQRTVFRTFTSNEIQRESDRILFGQGTTQTKLETVMRLQEEAVANQDFSLAQNLASQSYALQIQSQKEAEAAVAKFRAASTSQKNDFIKDLTKGFDDVTLPNGQKVTPLAALEDNFAQTGDVIANSKAAAETLEAIAASIIEQYQSADTQEEVDKLEEKYGPGLNELGDKLFVKLGGIELNYQSVINTVANDEFNNPLFGLKAERNEATGETSFKLQKNNVDNFDFVRRINERGEEEFMPVGIRTDQDKLRFGTSTVGRGLNAQITDQGEIVGNDGSINMGGSKVHKNDSQTIGNRLSQLGITATTNGTTLNIVLPGENVERTATIQPDGSIRYFDDNNNLLEVGLMDRNLGSNDLGVMSLAGQPRAVSPEELSDFGSQSGFGGQLSAPSVQGSRFVSDILGNTRAPAIMNLNSPIRTGNDFSGFGTAVTSSLLQTSGFRQKQVQLQQQTAQQQVLLQQQQQAVQIQSGRMTNLNQTPVQQFTSDGIRRNQLQVNLPQAQPRLTIAAPKVQPNINVTAPAPTPTIRIGSAPSAPRLTVR